MPRPKVPAHQRQRAAEACSLCRETKKRCSGTAPCSQCQRRGLERQCFMTYAPRGSRARAKTQTSNRSASNAGSTTESWPQDLPGLLSPEREPPTESCPSSIIAEDNQFQPVSPSESNRGEYNDSSKSNPCTDNCSATNPSRMLRNLRGERGKTLQLDITLFTLLLTLGSVYRGSCLYIIPQCNSKFSLSANRSLTILA